MANLGTPILGLPTTVGGLSGSEWLPIVQGGTTKRTQVFNIAFSGFFPAGIDYVITASAGVIPVGIAGTGLQVPFNCTITIAELVGSSPVGSAVVNIWKCTDSQYDGGLTHPVVGDSITGSNPLTVAVGSKATSSLVGWTTTLTQGDWLWYKVNSCAVFTGITVALKTNREIP